MKAVLTVRACDLYKGYEFKICAVLKDGEVRRLPSDKLKWQSCGKLQVENGQVVSLGDKYDKVVAQVINRNQQIVASDYVILTDENGAFDNWIMGISGLDQSDDRNLKRTHDAKDRDYYIDYGAGRIATDFDGVFDFPRFVDGSGNHFVVIPTLFWKYKDGELCITPQKGLPDFQPYACFVNPHTGHILDRIAIGCYKSDIGLDSKPNQYKMALTLQQWRNKIDLYNVNQCYFIRNEYVNQLLRDLFVITFASRSLTYVFKQDIESDAINTKTGSTDSIQDTIFSNPLNCCGYNQQTKTFKLFGIEDAFDGGAEWIEGLSWDASTQTLSYRHNFTDNLHTITNVPIMCNRQNVQSLHIVENGDITLLCPKSGTLAFTGWYDNSLILLGDEAGVTTSPTKNCGAQRFGILSYFSANPQADSAYARLCCFEREEMS